MPNLIMASAFAMLFFALFSDNGPVDAGRFHDLHRQAGVKVLLHKEEDGGRSKAERQALKGGKK